MKGEKSIVCNAFSLLRCSSQWPQHATSITVIITRTVVAVSAALRLVGAATEALGTAREVVDAALRLSRVEEHKIGKKWDEVGECE